MNELAWSFRPGNEPLPAAWMLPDKQAGEIN